MDPLCRYIRVPCTLLRILLISTLVIVASFYSGNSLWLSLGYGLACLLLMQMGYFVALVILVVVRSKRKN